MKYSVKLTIAIRSSDGEVTYSTLTQNVNAQSKEEALKIIDNSEIWLYNAECEKN